MTATAVLCPNRDEHTDGFETGGYGGGSKLNGEPVKLVGSHRTHDQVKCPGCDLYVILVPRESAP